MTVMRLTSEMLFAINVSSTITLLMGIAASYVPAIPLAVFNAQTTMVTISIAQSVSLETIQTLPPLVPHANPSL